MNTPLHNLAFYGGGSGGGGGGGGGGGAAEPERDVNFIDYDGTIVHSYTAAEFAELTALPDNPSHDGLTAQGWNWSLADAQAYVADYGKLWVGQMYITDDGKTRIYIKLEEGLLALRLGIAVNGSVDVDWGDGSEHDTVTGSDAATVVSTRHTYAEEGEYVIALAVTGEMALMGNGTVYSQVIWSGTASGVAAPRINAHYRNTIQRAEIGENCRIGNYAFCRCHALKSITMPIGAITGSSYVLTDCLALKSVTVPSGTDSLSVENDYSLTSISFPNGITNINVGYCYVLKDITLPDSVSVLFFSYCRSLMRVTVPSSVTTIGASAFGNCQTLFYIKFTRATPPTVSNSNAWTMVPENCIIYVPKGKKSAYTSATNYPSSSTFTYVEYDP